MQEIMMIQSFNLEREFVIITFLVKMLRKQHFFGLTQTSIAFPSIWEATPGPIAFVGLGQELKRVVSIYMGNISKGECCKFQFCTSS